MDISIFGLNIIDLIIFGIIFTSASFAYIHGFSWELMSLLSWVVALLAVWYLSWTTAPWLGAIIGHYLGISLPYFILVGVSGLLIFIAATMILSALTSFITTGPGAMQHNFLDRVLGFFYGVGRGVIIITCFMLVYSYFVPPEQYPTQLTSAKSYLFLKDMTDIGWSLIAGLTDG